MQESIKESFTENIQTHIAAAEALPDVMAKRASHGSVSAQWQ